MPRINFLFVLIILLTACAPNATLAPLPTVTLSPVVTEAVTIDMNPTGLIAHGASILAAPAPDSTNPISEVFVPPTRDDAKNLTGGEAEIPDIIKDVVADRKAQMEKQKANIAEICGVPIGEVKLVFKEGLVDDHHPWTIVYEAGKYTCWARDDATGLLGKYPTYWDKTTGEVITEGNSFDRVEGKMDWAGTVPVILNREKYLIPEALTGVEFGDLSYWSDLSVGTVESTELVANPIALENMLVLTKAGYKWDPLTGALINPQGNPTLSLRDGQWVDSDEIVSTLEALKIVETGGKDFEGRDFVALTREIDGMLHASIPSGEWEVPVDIAAAQRYIDTNAMTNPTNEVWGTWENITFETMPVIDQKDVDSGLLFISRQLMGLREWPENVRIPTLTYQKYDGWMNQWVITQYDNLLGETPSYWPAVPIPGGRPIVWGNDPIINMDVVRYFDESTKQWIINAGVQYYYKDGEKIVLNQDYRDVDPNDPNFYITQYAVQNPTWELMMPEVNLPGVTELLPSDLWNRIDEIERTGTQPTTEEAGIFPVGDEIYQLQSVHLRAGFGHSRIMQAYLMDEQNPFWDQYYPGK